MNATKRNLEHMFPCYYCVTCERHLDIFEMWQSDYDQFYHYVGDTSQRHDVIRILPDVPCPFCAKESAKNISENR